jgi:hypothetical protein
LDLPQLNKWTVKAKVGPTIANLLKFSAQTIVSSRKTAKPQTPNGKSINLRQNTIMTQESQITVTKKSPKANFANPPKVAPPKKYAWDLKRERASFDKTRNEFFSNVKSRGCEGKNNSFEKGACYPVGGFNYFKNDCVVNKKNVNVNDNLHVASGFKTTGHFSMGGVEPDQMVGNLLSDAISSHNSPGCNFFESNPITPGAKSRSSGPSDFVNINSYLNE